MSSFSFICKTKTTALAISNYIWDGSNMICEYASSHDPSAAHRLSLRLGASCRRNSAQVESSRAQSTALLPFLPALGGETAIKQPTGLFYLCFPLIPNRQKTVFLTLYSHFRRFSLGQRCSCVLFRPLFPYVPDLFVVKYVVVLHCPRFIQQRIPMISP